MSGEERRWLRGGGWGPVLVVLFVLLAVALPVGRYVFYFGIDHAENGNVDHESLVYDSIELNVVPSR